MEAPRMSRDRGATLPARQGDYVIVSTHARQYRAWVTGLSLDGFKFVGYECEPGTRQLRYVAREGKGYPVLRTVEGLTARIIEVVYRPEPTRITGQNFLTGEVQID